MAHMLKHRTERFDEVQQSRLRDLTHKANQKTEKSKSTEEKIDKKIIERNMLGFQIPT